MFLFYYNLINLYKIQNYEKLTLYFNDEIETVMTLTNLEKNLNFIKKLELTLILKIIEDSEKDNNILLK